MVPRTVLFQVFILFQILSFFGVHPRSRSHRSGFRKGLPLNNDDDEDNSDNEVATNDLNANDEELDPYWGRKVDPEGSWRTFMRYSVRNTNKPKKNKKRQNRQNTLHGPQGPPGPQGPAGPPGPPGSLVTKDEILEELKGLIKEAAEKRAQELFTEMTSMNISSIPVADSSLPLISVPRIAAGFNMRLGANEFIARRTLMELNAFQQPFEAGAFQRGDVFNAKEGRFYAPRDGVYQFTANLHIRVRSRKKPVDKMRRSDNIKVVICIESLCQKYTSIETVTGLESNSKVFTVQAAGMLELQPRQYVSVYVDNSSSLNIAVLTGSEFSGLLLGI